MLDATDPAMSRSGKRQTMLPFTTHTAANV
jgi:hypothetical protein